jgi:ribosome-associated translation inhibitor RaiA
MHELVLKIEKLEQHFFKWHEEVVSHPSIENDTESFSAIEDEFKLILDEASTLSKEENGDVFDALQRFHDKLEAHQKKIEEHLNELKGSFDQSVQYLKASKAYTQF